MNTDRHRRRAGGGTTNENRSTRGAIVDASREELNQITEKVIGCAYTVANEPGNGFLEKVHENALALELRQAGLAVTQQHAFVVRYRGEAVGDFAADLLWKDVCWSR